MAKSDPKLWKAFDDGNCVVNKNAIPFCAIVTDHALEHKNKMTKVGGVGLFDITQNHSALTNVFLVAPEELSDIIASEVNNGAISVKIFSPDTDVLVFAIRHYPTAQLVPLW